MIWDIYIAKGFFAIRRDFRDRLRSWIILDLFIYPIWQSYLLRTNSILSFHLISSLFCLCNTHTCVIQHVCLPFVTLFVSYSINNLYWQCLRWFLILSLISHMTCNLINNRVTLVKLTLILKSFYKLVAINNFFHLWLETLKSNTAVESPSISKFLNFFFPFSKFKTIRWSMTTLSHQLIPTNNASSLP